MSTKPWTPEQLPKSFWELIAAADGDHDRFLALLKQKTRTELYDFHVFYDRAANIFTSEPYADPDGSEDAIFDTANWIVAQGKEYYFHILAHPEKTPWLLPNDCGLGFFGAIGQAYYELFGEELDVYRPSRLQRRARSSDGEIREQSDRGAPYRRNHHGHRPRPRVGGALTSTAFRPFSELCNGHDAKPLNARSARSLVRNASALA